MLVSPQHHLPVAVASLHLQSGSWLRPGLRFSIRVFQLETRRQVLQIVVQCRLVLLGFWFFYVFRPDYDKLFHLLFLPVRWISCILSKIGGNLKNAAMNRDHCLHLVAQHRKGAKISVCQIVAPRGNVNEIIKAEG